jgi:hypothetical protein
VGQFAYRLLKDGRVLIDHRDRHVTGNFKRGNERMGRRTP